MSDDLSQGQLEARFVAAARSTATQGSGAGGRTTLLHIGVEHAVVLSGQGDRSDQVQQLDVGTARIARDFFHHDPPRSDEIERAIDFVEDQIMRLGQRVGVDTTLWSTSSALQALSAVVGPTLPIEKVEQWFQQLASASLGRPSAMIGLPPGQQAAAALVVLREFMHHRGHASVVVIDEPEAPIEDHHP